jgi:hypothetical protein
MCFASFAGLPTPHPLQVVTDDLGIKMEKVELSALGSAKKVRAKGVSALSSTCLLSSAPRLDLGVNGLVYWLGQPDQAQPKPCRLSDVRVQQVWVGRRPGIAVRSALHNIVSQMATSHPQPQQESCAFRTPSCGLTNRLPT